MIGSATARTDIFSLYGKLRENEKDDHFNVLDAAGKKSNST